VSGSSEVNPEQSIALIEESVEFQIKARVFLEVQKLEFRSSE